MGWGVNDYPTPHGREPEDDRYECESFRCSNLIERGEEGKCHDERCQRTVLCDAHTFECGDCERTFCLDHILIHKHDDGFATYRCEECDRQAQERAA